jgi:hypothetical protein
MLAEEDENVWQYSKWCIPTILKIVIIMFGMIFGGFYIGLQDRGNTSSFFNISLKQKIKIKSMQREKG